MTEGNHEKNPSQFGQNPDLNSEPSEYKSRVMNFDWHCSLCNQKLYHRCTSQTTGAGIRASIFNCCSNATVRTQEVPLVHASYDVITLSHTESSKYYACIHTSVARGHSLPVCQLTDAASKLSLCYSSSFSV